MKKLYLFRFLLAVIIGSCLIPSLSNGSERETKTTAEKPVKAGTAYSGYSVDGRTSASVLAAKRSHAVDKKDEIGLSIFSGLFVIAVIGFFSQKFFEKK